MTVWPTSEPFDPVVLSGETGQGGLNLRWTPPAGGVGHYEVYRSVAPYCTSWCPPDRIDQSIVPPKSSYTDAGAFALPLANYFYIIHAVDPAGINYPDSNRIGVFELRAGVWHYYGLNFRSAWSACCPRCATTVNADLHRSETGNRCKSASIRGIFRVDWHAVTGSQVLSVPQHGRVSPAGWNNLRALCACVTDRGQGINPVAGAAPKPAPPPRAEPEGRPLLAPGRPVVSPVQHFPLFPRPGLPRGCQPGC